jgi:hypothetical protein
MVEVLLEEIRATPPGISPPAGPEPVCQGQAISNSVRGCLRQDIPIPHLIGFTAISLTTPLFGHKVELS